MNRFQFVEDHKDAYGVKRLCEVIEIARSSFYAWLAAAPGRAARAADDARLAAARAHAAQRTWRRTSFAERAAVMRRAAELLRERAGDYAALMTVEMGKTFVEGRAEIEKCAFHCDWFAAHAETYLADERVDLHGKEGVDGSSPSEGFTKRAAKRR